MPKDSFNLAEAAELVKHDFQSSFLPFLHDWELFERDQAARLAALPGKIEGYDARPPRELPIPKSSLLSRPGALPIVEDWILYTAVTAAIAREIEKNLIPPEQEVLFSFRWNETDPVRMVKAKASGYGDFRAKSLRLLDDYPFALETDITSYFEQIDFKILRAVLLRLSAMQEDVEYLVRSFLRRWTHRSGRGIPQGPWASSYLGNCYLDSVDKGMLLRGHTIVRYMDDIRVFCHDPTQAKRAVLDLSELTRELGLSIQAAKTRIYNCQKAQKVWHGYAAWLEDFQQGELRERLQEYLAEWGPYGELSDVEPLATEIEQQRLQELLDSLVREPAYKLDRKGLKFLLGKFLETGSDYAVDFCIQFLRDLPDLAPSCSQYLARFADRETVQQRIHQFISSAECIYDWQAMHLIGAMLSAPVARPDVVTLCLDLARNRNRDIGLRSVCIDLIARCGREEQVRELCRSFTKEACEEVRASIILASRRLQQVERRTFLGACRGFSPALDAAVAESWSAR